MTADTEKDMINLTCCFTGHRIIEKNDFKSLKQSLDETVNKLAEEGYIYFGAGGALGFDALAAKAVISLKRKNKKARLILVLPCKNQDKYWSAADRAEYEYIKKNADKIIYTSEIYYSGCMHLRNRHLVENSSVCVAYVKKTRGGAAYTVCYAKKLGRRVIFVC